MLPTPAPRARDGAGIVADLCRLNPLPNLVVVPGGKDPAEDFAAAPAEPAHARWTVPLPQLLQDVVRRSESPAAEAS